MGKLKSEGVCVYCEETLAKNKLTRHLNSHLKKNEKIEGNKYFHVRVDAAEMFLHLLVSHKTDMSDLDYFLKQIWMQCCGHLSAFSYNDNEGYHEIDMYERVGKAILLGKQYQYKYDFGSTTQVEIKALKEFVLKEDETVILLSRNEPLELYCHTCEKDIAENICILFHKEGFMFCKECTEDHADDCEDAADYALLPVVNSPRMGVCAYSGGSIDLERDGVYQLNK